MRDRPTAPTCIVVNCERLAALTDVTKGMLWSYNAHYCADCYTSLLNGVQLSIDPGRLQLIFVGAESDAQSKNARVISSID
jgi:hypothetical protein